MIVTLSQAERVHEKAGNIGKHGRCVSGGRDRLDDLLYLRRGNDEASSADRLWIACAQADGLIWKRWSVKHCDDAAFTAEQEDWKD